MLIIQRVCEGVATFNRFLLECSDEILLPRCFIFRFFNSRFLEQRSNCKTLKTISTICRHVFTEWLSLQERKQIQRSYWKRRSSRPTRNTTRRLRRMTSPWYVCPKTSFSASRWGQLVFPSASPQRQWELSLMFLASHHIQSESLAART